MNEVLERHGKVVAITGDGVASVRLERPTSCAQCASRGVCGSDSGKEHVVALHLSEQSRIGQAVTVVASPASVVTAALLGYALPAIGLLFGAIAAEIGLGGDGAAVAGAVLGLVGGLLVARVLSGTVFRKILSAVACQERHEASFQSGESV